jgi:hypothetical protein
VPQLANRHALLSHDHFTVDGPRLEAWASHKSFRPESDPSAPPPSDEDGPGYTGRNPSLNLRGETRSNTTHQSVTDPDARLTRKTHHGGAILGYQASVLMENRHGLIVQTDVRAPSGHAECEAALERLTLLDPAPHAGRRQGTIDRSSLRACGRSTSPPMPVRMSVAIARDAAPRTVNASTRGSAARGMGERRGMRGTRSANANGN